MMRLDSSQLYLEIPEIRLPEKFHNTTEPFVTPQHQQAMDFISGANFGTKTGMIDTTSGSTWEVSAIHPSINKELVAWCRKTFSLQFNTGVFIRTSPDSIGPWHCEGPLMKGRQCALNFLVQSEEGHSKAQWGVHKHIDIHPNQIEKHFAGAVDDTDVEIIGEYVSQKFVPFFYNTACLHRSFNTSADTYRTILSVCLPSEIGIEHVQNLYSKGKLLK